jgi:class 3 adenylate cyclase
MRCSNCGSDNPADRRFCGDCGALLANRCPKCGAENPSGKRFCGDCGTTLLAREANVQSPASSPNTPEITISAEQTAPAVADGERKTVTALFADLKGSTELMRDLDPEEARAIIDPALRIMVEAVRRYDGYVVQSTGDGIFALFGAPLAHEDHPQRALYAALQIQKGLRDQGLRAAPGRPAVEARIGVNTGEVVVRTVETGGKLEYTPIGHTANLASRLQSVAPVGSVAIGSDTRRLVEGYFELRPLGSAEVKGVSERLQVYEVIGPGPLRTHFQLFARRGLVKFVGREREMGELGRALELARDGRGQLIAVVAEAGTGKSRLFHEFKAMLSTEYKLLEAYSVSHGKASAWLPVLELLRGYFGIEDTDDSAMRRTKLTAQLAALDPALAGTQPYLFGLLGIVQGVDPLAQMDPRIRRQRTLEALKRIIMRESLAQPTVVIFEDLHWIDSETQGLLDVLADSVANSRILLLVNYRPEYRHEWANKSHYSQLRLDALGRASAGEMLAELLGKTVALRPLKRLIIERSEGNPFFIEEIVQSLFEDGALLRNGTVRLTRPLEELKVPATVQSILASRIDRLSEDRKDLLQTLATIGREFSLFLVRPVIGKSDDDLERMMNDLLIGEFVFEQPAVGDAKYIFKHALTQQVAYDSMLIERRKALHGRIGATIEALFADRLDDHLTDLAHHYRLSRNIRKGLEYL